jgi:hypothetical protein
MGLLMLPPLVPASLVAPVLGAELELELGLVVLLLVLAVGVLGPELQQMFAMRENKRADCLVVLSLLLVVGPWY